MSDSQTHSSTFDIESLNVTLEEIEQFCLHWHIISLEIFGSAASGTMTEDSDIDLLAAFDPNINMSLLTEAEINIEFENLFGRKVDLLDREVIENSKNRFRKASILEGAKTIYELR